MASYLDEIVAQHRLVARDDRRTPKELEASLGTLALTRGFTSALRSRSRRGDHVAVIAEIKRRSPSKGSLAPLLDPSELAKRYEDAGAACLSVLTDGPHFGGSAEDLNAAAQAANVPILRKDFTVSQGDVYDARAMGADAILLIAAALDDHEIATYLVLAEALSLDVLVEVHDEEELERALAAGASLIGVNQRDLQTFEVDPRRALHLGPRIPEHCVKVAESGIKERDEVLALIDAGFDAILVGEALVTAHDPGQALRDLSGA